MIYDRLTVLTNLFLEKYPEVKPFTEIETTYDNTGYSVEKFIADWDKIYEKLSTQHERNELAKSGISLDKRIIRFIEIQYGALIELDKYYLYFMTDDITEKDLHDMNATYKKLKDKKTGIVCNILRK